MGAQGALGTDKKHKHSIEKTRLGLMDNGSWTIPVSDFEGDASYFKAHKRFNIGASYAR